MSDKLDEMNLPRRIFMFTIDQVADIMNVTHVVLTTGYIWYDRRMFGRPDPHRILSHNIAPDGADPDWRISEDELVRYLKFKGFRFTRTGTY